ncbi:MAG: tRNA (N(6)-L-threonylcarbamoyladenosine(37)-C(2))-methylthiotransferase MtaB [Peptococcaceae bacterium]|jgi:threonylcarbamoyladenosine tRNA methylthiotransferase MtaB|nr:tRNA (N(6)-L-threonylcarbamoyladenosine(37)-C(2))-methylthiotransferase MtaB [Peptococcaceae bacterium]
MKNTPSVYLTTLGCKVNQTESEAVAQLFREAGYTVANVGEKADVIVVNTCTVTDTGDSKSRQMIRRMARTHPGSLIVVMGCYAQTAPEEVLKIEGVDLVIGTQRRSELPALIEKVKEERQPCQAVAPILKTRTFEELPLLAQERRTRATIKIQDGCDQFCTYCVIPYARGPNRSRNPQKILEEARQLVEMGYREIVLTGIHTGAYGRDAGAAWDLARLIRELSALKELRRLRLGSIEPVELTPWLIEEIFSSPVVCPHLHIPLQSGSDAVLTKMRRPYTLREYGNLLEKLYRANPELAVSTDVIAGFPGETEEDHVRSLAFVQGCQFSGIHVFPYSQRRGTPAANFPEQISKKVKGERSRELLRVAASGRQAYQEKFIGREAEVLIERVAAGAVWGRTPNYLALKLPVPPERTLTSGEFICIILERNYFLNP